MKWSKYVAGYFYCVRKNYYNIKNYSDVKLMLSINFMQYFQNDIYIYFASYVILFLFIFDLIRLDLNYGRPLNQGYIWAASYY